MGVRYLRIPAEITMHTTLLIRLTWNTRTETLYFMCTALQIIAVRA